MLLGLFISITFAYFSNAQSCGSVTCGADEQTAQVGSLLAFGDLEGIPMQPGHHVVVGWPTQEGAGLTMAYGNPTDVPIAITVNSIAHDTGVAFMAEAQVGYQTVHLDADRSLYLGHGVEILLTYVPTTPPSAMNGRLAKHVRPVGSSLRKVPTGPSCDGTCNAQEGHWPGY